MKILITGATGFVGTPLAGSLARSGHEVRSLGRGPSSDHDWSERSLGAGVDWAEAVVHLAGENLFARRWSESEKKELRRSRVDTTDALATAMAKTGRGVLVTSSAVGYYGPSDETGLDESAPAADDFLGRLCADWEAAAAPAAAAGVRVAHLRTGVVLGRGGGALAKMLPPFRLGLGGPLGSGRQWVSWIHLDDLVSLYQFVVEHPEARGPYNGTAPRPVTMKELAASLGRVLRRPAVLPVPAFALRLALGEVADILLTGQHVVPKRALEEGFAFRHELLEEALADLLDKPLPASRSVGVS